MIFHAMDILCNQRYANSVVHLEASRAVTMAAGNWSYIGEVARSSAAARAAFFSGCPEHAAGTRCRYCGEGLLGLLDPSRVFEVLQFRPRQILCPKSERRTADKP
jgi:hypothetical protein